MSRKVVVVAVAGVLATALLFACQPTRSYRRPPPGAGHPMIVAAAGGGERQSPAHDTEAYARINDNPFLAARDNPAVDVLDRRRHGVVRERAPVPQRGAAAADRTRSASRSW